jgi:hypothetical protein
MKLPVTICLLALLTGCTVPQAPERAPEVPLAPSITVTVRGGDQILRSDTPRHQSPPEPDYEESYYQRRPVYRPEPLPYREPSPLPYYTRPDPADQIPLEPYRRTYPPYTK